MKHYSMLLAVLLVIPASIYAQGGRGGQWHDDASVLSVFSESGEPFFLVLNGINQNDAPATKVRVEGLPQYGNDIEILFIDRRTPAIRRKLTIADPVDGNAVNMTLKIVRERGYAKLKFHKCTEVEHGYRAERDEYVVTYGRGRREHNIAPPPPPSAMDGRTFEEAKRSVKNASFDDTKLSTAKAMLGANYLNTDQVIEICRLFSFEDTRLSFAKFAYSKTVDANNYFKVGNVFSFSGSREDLNNFISAGGR